MKGTLSGCDPRRGQANLVRISSKVRPISGGNKSCALNSLDMAIRQELTTECYPDLDEAAGAADAIACSGAAVWG